MTHDQREAQHAVEGIILRRIYEKRLQGFTIETAKEIVETLTASPGEQKPQPAAGWNEAIEAAINVVKPWPGAEGLAQSEAEKAVENIRREFVKALESLRREAPAPEGVAGEPTLAIRLEARPTNGSADWTEIFPAQLNWVAKAGHEVRAIEAPSRPDAGGGNRADERERLIAFADYYLANNAAENGTDELIRQLRDALAAQSITEPVYKAVERILEEKSAWIAGPNDEVTKSIALQAVAAAHKLIAESCSICGGEYPVESALFNPPAAAEQPLEDNRWITEAKATLDRLSAFLQKTGAPHRVDWREWIDSADKHLGLKWPSEVAAVESNASAGLSEFARDLAAKQEPLGQEFQLTGDEMAGLYQVTKEPESNASAEAAIRKIKHLVTTNRTHSALDAVVAVCDAFIECEADGSVELEDARAEAADSLRTLDAIAEYVGCPHDEELTVEHVRQHYMKLENAAQRQGIEDAGRIANAQAYASAEARLREALVNIRLHIEEILDENDVDDDGVLEEIDEALFPAAGDEAKKSEGGSRKQPFDPADAAGVKSGTVTFDGQTGRPNRDEVGASQTPGSSMSFAADKPIAAEQALRPSDQTAERREIVARIINPEVFAKYDAELAKDRRAENGKRWADVCYGEAICRALAKADAILAALDGGAGA